MSPKVVVNQSNLKVVVNKSNNTVEVTSPGPQGNFYNSFKGDWSSATAYFVGDIVFYNGSSYVATANSTNSQPPSASWAAVAKGIPGGGTTGQIIVKNSSTDYDYSWTNNYTINTTSPLTGGANINTNPTLAINSTSDDTANYVVQRDANQSFSIGAVRFDTSSVQTTAVGKLYWDGNETLNLGLGSTGTVTIAVGQEVINYVTNAEATTLNVGEVVYLFGAQGDRPSVKRASNASDATSAKTFGIVAESIAAGGAGFVVNKGIVAKINTSAYTPGDILWLGATPGTFTTTKPVAPAHLVFVGVVLRTNAGNGLVYVSPQNGYELEEIHDVLITSPTDGQFLTYESTTDLWKNKGISATAPITYNAGTRTIAANAASTSAAGVVQLTDSTSSTSTTTAATPNSVKAAYDLAAAAIPLSQKAAANGVATLDASGLVPTNQLPALAITNTFVVASQAAMLALSAETGDVAIRTDLNKSFILTATPASTLANWQELLTPPDAVTSVDGRVGAVTLTDKYAQLATANTFLGAQTATSFIVSGSTVPTNGIYLPAANTLGFATNGTEYARITSTGSVYFNSSTGGVGQFNLLSTGFSGINMDLRYYSADANGAAILGRKARGTESSPTAAQSGDFIVGLVGRGYGATAFGTSNVGLLGFYAAENFTDSAQGTEFRLGTTPIGSTTRVERMRINAAGEVGIGAPPGTAINFLIGKNITGSTDSRVLQIGAVVQSDVTGSARIFFSAPSTQATTFNVGTLNHFQAAGATIGAGSTIGVQNGFLASAAIMAAGVTNAYAFRGLIASASGAWNVYMDGTAANYFAGQTTVGSTSLTLGSGSVAQQFGIVAGAATTVGAVIRGAASQTANLTEWQNSAGGIVLRVDSAGGLRGTYIMSGNVGSGVLGQITSYAESATTVGLAIRGAASQTADLQQWQNNSGTVLSYVRNDGVIFATQGLQGTAWLSAGTYIVGANLISNIGTATNVGVLTRGAASQSADLVQLQDSSGNILNSIDNSGNIRSEAQLIQYGAEGSLLQNVPTRVHPAETLLKQAVWWIDAAHTSASSQTINNLGWGGSALNVTNGSSTSADSNDAQYLAWDGVNYVYLPGVASNHLSTPSTTALQIVGDIDLRIQIAMDDWTPANPAALLGKWNSAGTSRSYLLALTATGTLQFYWSADGTNALVATSSASVSFTDGTVGWVRATIDVDNGASGRDIRFFTSTDGITWTQLGTTQTSAGITSIFANAQEVTIGVQSVNQWMASGKVFRAQILNGIDGVPVLDVDTSVIATGAATSFTALTGQTVTVNRSTSGRKTVCVTNPLWLFGTDDYMEVNNRWLEHTGTNYLYLPGVASNYASAPDSAALDITGDIDLRVKVALDDWTPSANSALLYKWDNAGLSASYGFRVNATTGVLIFLWTANGSTVNSAASTVAPTVTDGSTLWVRATLDVDNGASGNTVTFFTSTDGTTWTQLGNTVTQAGVTSIFSGTGQLEVGSFAGGASPARGKFFRAQVLNGIGGTLAFDANFETGITSNLPTTFTESSANAATVTINYSGTGYRSAGVIASTYVYPGNPNTFKLSTTSLLDFGATDSFTLLAIARQWATPNSYGVFFEKRQASPNNGYSFTQGSTNYRPEVAITDGTNVALNSSTTPVSAAGAVTAYSMIVDRSAQTLYFNINGSNSATVSTSSVGNIASYFPFAVGRRTYTAALYNDMEFVAGAVFRRVLTAREIAILNNYFQGRVA